MPAPTDLTPEMLDRLEAIAKAATPGPWTLTQPPKDEDDGWQTGVTIGATRGGKIYATPPGGQYPANDAKHIAAASPDVVLALVAAAKELAKHHDLALAAMQALASALGSHEEHEAMVAMRSCLDSLYPEWESTTQKKLGEASANIEVPNDEH